MQFVKRHESPEEFHLWVALTTLSAAVERDVFVEEAFKFIYPNLYTILVAPSGVCKKGGAIEIGAEMLRDAHAANFFANKATIEGLLDELDYNAKGGTDNIIRPATTFICVPEFGTFMGRDALKSGLMAALTDLFDCPKFWRYKTKTAGDYRFRNLAITILGATTPRVMHLSIPQEVIGGGFTSRVCFICQDVCERKPVVRRLTDEEKAARFKLVYDLLTIKSLKGEFSWTKQAMELYDTWYLKNEERSKFDERFIGYAERKPHLVLRVAMLHSIAEDNELIIAKHNMEFGMAMFSSMEETMVKAFAFLGTADAGNMERIRRTLQNAGGELGHSDLQKKVFYHMNTEELKKALDEMLSLEMIILVIKGRGQAYRLVD